MIITYHQAQFFKIQQGDTTIAFNPISKDSKLKNTRFGADIVLITTNNKDFNGVENVSSKNKEPFIVKGPGEYEIQGIFIKGSLSHSNYEGKDKINTIYSMVIDGIKVGFLGALGSKDLDDNAKIILDETDILFVPIGGDGVLDASDASVIATKLGAKIIIPMHYGEIGEKGALERFLKESGSKDAKPVDKLTLKKKDVDERSGEVIILKVS